MMPTPQIEQVMCKQGNALACAMNQFDTVVRTAPSRNHRVTNREFFAAICDLRNQAQLVVDACGDAGIGGGP